MVFRFELLCHGNAESLDTSYFGTKTMVYTLLPRKYETSDLNFMIKSLFHDDVKITNTVDAICFRSKRAIFKSKN